MFPATPAIVAPADHHEYLPTAADYAEQGRHFAMVEALRHWPELANLIQCARMVPELCEQAAAFDGYAEAKPVRTRATEATF